MIGTTAPAMPIGVTGRRLQYRRGVAVAALFLLLITPVHAQRHIPSVPVETVAVAESETLRLFYDETRTNVYVEDLRSGSVWSGVVDPDEAAYRDANLFWKNQMASLFSFSYADFSSDSYDRTVSCIAAEDAKIETTSIIDGVRLDVAIEALGLGLSIEITLDRDSIEVRIPFDSIVEESDFGIVSVGVMPFLGSARDDEVGYMLVPDGSGALYRFKETGVDSQAAYNRLDWYAYAPREVDFEVYREQRASGIRNCHLPVFGVKKSEGAFVAIAEDGDTDMSIALSQSGAAIDINRIAGEFFFRHQYELFLSDISVRGAYAQSISPLRIDRELIPGDRRIRYLFLSGSHATYSGMAQAVRTRLQERGLLPVTKPKESIPVVLSLFGGIMEDRLLFDNYVSLTTLPQAWEIVESIRQRGVEDLIVNLVGWARGGYGTQPVFWPPERQLGGKSSLRRLAASCAELPFDLYVQLDMITAMKENGGFNALTDVVKSGNSLAVTSESGNRYILSPDIVTGRVQELLQELGTIPVSGITFERMGNLIYQDYNERYPSTRQQTVSSWISALDEVSKNLGHVAIAGGNLRLMPSVDLVVDIPFEGSGFLIIDEEVPFWQLVYHGTVYYASDPANLFYDAEEQFLKWIEYGAVPYYYLTYRPSEFLKNTDFNHLFSSHYLEWLDRLIEDYNRFNDDFGDFYQLQMSDHEAIDEDLVRVAFADGTEVFLNYGTTGRSTGNGFVKPKDYLIVRAEGIAQ